MTEGLVFARGDGDTPDVYVHVNPVYALYHYLVREGLQPAAERVQATADEAIAAAAARRVGGVHGIWDAWEVPLASADSVDDAISGLRTAMTETVNTLGAALHAAETEFRERIWPARRGAIDEAFQTLRDLLAHRFADMARRQGKALGLVWPERIDAYLVTDCYDWHGAYSHPMTIDITRNQGFTLCETFLHEATHVADVHSGALGRSSLHARLTAALSERGIQGLTAWNAWHAIIFAASAQQVRSFIDPGYTDYAVTHGLYEHFKLPDLSHLWSAFSSGGIDESELVQHIADQVRERAT